MVGKSIQNQEEIKELIKEKVGYEKALFLKFQYDNDREMYYITETKIINNKRGKPKKLIIYLASDNFIDFLEFTEDNSDIYNIVEDIKHAYTGEFYTPHKEVIETIGKVSKDLENYLREQYNKLFSK